MIERLKEFGAILLLGAIVIAPWLLFPVLSIVQAWPRRASPVRVSGERLSE